jgi:hypothetical protein
LADGANQVYEVSNSSWSSNYVFRIALPVDPQLKIESEMATLKFLSQKTGMPVPKPIAWSSTVEEKLGYEWALVEKLPGVELRDVWHKMPWEKKEQVVETIAGFLVQLWGPSTRLNSIGSLYLESAKSLNLPFDEPGFKDSGKEGFDIGPSVDSVFFFLLAVDCTLLQTVAHMNLVMIGLVRSLIFSKNLFAPPKFF